MRLRDRAVVLIAVAGLVYFIVLLAVGVCVGVETSKAIVAPIARPVGIEVLRVNHNSDLLIAVQDVINVFFGKNFIAHSGEVAAPTEGAFFGNLTARNAGWHNDSSVVWIVREWLVANRCEPIVCIVHSTLSDEYFRGPSRVESGSLPEIDHAKINPHSLTGYDLYIHWIDHVAIPYVGALVDLKLLRSVIDGRASESIRFQHGSKLESVNCKDEHADDNCRKFNSKSMVVLYEFYKAHRFLLILASIFGNLWFSGQFLIYSGRYGRFRFGKCLFSLFLAFVLAAHAIALIALF
jgi:hypothetical protein